MNWGRYLRAMKARRIEYIETQRRAAINEPKRMTPELAKQILEHDSLLKDDEQPNRDSD